MAKMRVHELAKELEIKSQDVIDVLKGTQFEVKSANSGLEEEAIAMVKEAAKVVPEVGLVGFDIAITEKGPVMIEGNQLPGYDIYQSKIHLNSDGTGMKPLFDQVIYGKNN